MNFLLKMCNLFGNHEGWRENRKVLISLEDQESSQTDEDRFKFKVPRFMSADLLWLQSLNPTVTEQSNWCQTGIPAN